MLDRTMRKRFWFESAFAGLAFALALLTLLSQEWIEWLTGADPDGGNGSLEWMIVGVCAAVALVSVMLARREWRRIPSPA